MYGWNVFDALAAVDDGGGVAEWAMAADCSRAPPRVQFVAGL